MTNNSTGRRIKEALSNVASQMRTLGERAAKLIGVAITTEQPSKKVTPKTASATKAFPKKASAQRAATKKATGKKSPAKKATAKKASAKEASAKKTTATNVPARRAAVKKATAKKAPTKKAAAPPAPEPTTAEVRAWARSISIDVPDRGRLRPQIWQAWRDAHDHA